MECLIAIIILIGLIPVLLSFIKKSGTEESESKLYFLIQKLNCSKGEAKKILECYKWDCEKIAHLIKDYSTGDNNTDDDIINEIAPVLDENHIRCFKCGTINIYKANFCVKCGNSLQGDYVLKQLSILSTRTRTSVSNETSIEYIPCRSAEQMDHNEIITSGELHGEFIKVALEQSNDLIEVPYKSIYLISVYRETYKETHKEGKQVSLNPGKRFKKFHSGETDSHKEAYVCVIETNDRRFKIVEGKFNFRKSMTGELKYVFKDNLRTLIERICDMASQAELDEGALRLLGIKDQQYEEDINSDFM